MSKLHPHLPFDPRETSWSFACRLAAFHTGGAVQGLLASLGILPRDLRFGEKPALARLAEATGVGLDALARSTFRVMANRARQFREEMWQTSFVRLSEVRVCPACMAADEAEMRDLPPAATWKQRIAWSLRPVTTCPAHGLKLVTVAPQHASKLGLSDLASLVPLAGGISQLLSEARFQPPSVLQNWVHDRLAVRADGGGPWLAGQTIEQGVRACEMLGLVHRHGPQSRVASITADDWVTAGDHGFQIAREGRAAVCAALDHIRAMSSTKCRSRAPSFLHYGPLYDWLKVPFPVVGPGPIRDLLREHILDHDAFETGFILLCEPVAERRRHTTYSLAETIGLPRDEVCRRLVRVGLMTPGGGTGTRDHTSFPVASAERLCVDVGTAVPVVAAANLLACTKEQLESLRQAGILASMIDRGVSGKLKRPVLPMRHVTDLLAQVRSLSTEVGEVPDSFDLQAAATKLAVSYGDVVAMILSKQINDVRWLHLRSGLPAVRIPVSSIDSSTRSSP